MDQTAVIMTMYGKPELTDAVLNDLDNDIGRGMFKVYVVNNGPEYQNPKADRIWQMSTNLGWLRGINAGIHRAFTLGHTEVIFMDNDVRLSPNFITHMKHIRLIYPDALIAPVYDDVWEHQSISAGNASSYKPRDHDRRNLKFVDGTCQSITLELFKLLKDSGNGDWLDGRHFASHGWGADFDLGIRMKDAGKEIIVTEAAYLNHLRGTTNKSIKPDYEGEAGTEMNTGLHAKYGPQWSELLN